MQQLSLDFPPHAYVIPNHWGKAYHVLDEHHMTILWDLQPTFFYSIAAALDWCAQHGVEAEVPESTRRRWS